MYTTDTTELLKDPIVSPTSKKYVFPFKEGDGKNKQLLGGKGANLCEMMQIGLNKFHRLRLTGQQKNKNEKSFCFSCDHFFIE